METYSFNIHAYTFKVKTGVMGYGNKKASTKREIFTSAMRKNEVHGRQCQQNEITK